VLFGFVMIPLVWSQVDGFVDSAKALGRLVWLDATGEILCLDSDDQDNEQYAKAEAITRPLMEDSQLRSILEAVLLRRRLNLGLSLPIPQLDGEDERSVTP
jgi:hypothetical protein